MDSIEKVLHEKNILHHRNEGIQICNVKTPIEGFELIKEILYAIVNKRTVVYLSGGNTPKELYTALAQEEKLIPGAVGMIDERFGTPFHNTSNEKMIRDTGLLRYLQMRDIPFYPILKPEKTREETAHAYDETYRKLTAIFQKNVGILGIGTDGHTAGILANSKWQIANSERVDSSALILSYQSNDKFKERITMTFLGLSMLDVLLVLIFGKDKKEALELVFSQGTKEEIPARFFKNPEIAKKTLFITDQEV